MSYKNCSINWCSREAHTKGYCQLHYTRSLRGTDLNLPIRSRGEMHGLSSTPEYRVWSSMKKRCYRPKVQEYKYYGARGIKVCARWRESFAAFFEDMGPRPSSRHSIDRIDNDGDYEPKNCRWTTSQVQSINSRIDSCNISGKTGVTLHYRTLRWRATIALNGRAHHLGYFEHKEDAILARLKAEEKYFKPILENA